MTHKTAKTMIHDLQEFTDWPFHIRDLIHAEKRYSRFDPHGYYLVVFRGLRTMSDTFTLEGHLT